MVNQAGDGFDLSSAFLCKGGTKDCIVQCPGAVDGVHAHDLVDRESVGCEQRATGRPLPTT